MNIFKRKEFKIVVKESEVFNVLNFVTDVCDSKNIEIKIKKAASEGKWILRIVCSDSQWNKIINVLLEQVII